MANHFEIASSVNDQAIHSATSKSSNKQSPRMLMPDAGETSDWPPAEEPEAESDTDLLTHVYAYAIAEK